MFLRRIERRKNGKTHLYWSVVENKRLDGGRVVQRHVLYLGEINSSQAEVWRTAVAVFDTDAGGPRTLALFPEDRGEVVSATTPRWCGCACPKCACIVRGSGALVGWRACCGASCNSTGSTSGCRRGSEENGGVGITFLGGGRISWLGRGAQALCLTRSGCSPTRTCSLASDGALARSVQRQNHRRGSGSNHSP